MSDLLSQQQGSIYLITLNRVEKHNAFDDSMLAHLQLIIHEAEENASVKVIVLKANGPHFSAGADILWMQRMADYNKHQNMVDAMVLAQMMYTLHECTKPTIAMIQGAAYGGGAGIAAACDITIAGVDALFCFSEVKLGLVPAVISPYVIKAIGERATTELFMTGECINAQRAYELQLVQHVVPQNELLTFTMNYANKLANAAPIAIKACKALVREVAGKPIDQAMQIRTASIIAEKRVSIEGQLGLKAFLDKKTPQWN